MPLDRGIGDAVQQRDGSVAFPMSDGAHLVRCTVTSDALAIFIPDHDDPGTVFCQSRRKIERLARKKSNTGAIELDGSVTLTAADVLGLFPE